MNNSKEIQHLQDIKNLMERSSRFLSLSGLSGISAGLFALIGAVVAQYIIMSNRITYNDTPWFLYYVPELNIIEPLMYLGISILLLALASGLFFSWRKARKHGYKLWDHTTKRLLIQLFIPLITGGLFCLILIDRNYISLLASATLIFYGLALVNGGKYTLNEIRYLGISEIILGLLAGIITSLGLIFWAIGFGILHILYGSVMYFRYERK